MTTSAPTVTRVNLGSGELPIDGYTNVDQYCPADIQGDLRELDFTNLDEVFMSHALEHLPWADTPHVLQRIHGWLKPGGLLTIEVPDLAEIMANPGPDWQTYIYGCQSHPGEYHMSGYTVQTLGRLLDNAGFHNVVVRSFHSTHPYRAGMPCIKATANA